MKRAKKGPPIGRLGRGRPKTHQGYKGIRTATVARAKVRMPGNSGFIELRGDAVYDKVRQHLLLTISSRRREGNYGPGIFIREGRDWRRSKNEDGSAAAALQSLLDETAQRVQGRAYPERGSFLEKCCGGKNGIEFLANTCSRCSCWYCDLSGG